MDQTALLISDYLDRELANDDVELLAGLLRSDPAAFDRFVLNSFVHSQLLDWMDQNCGRVQPPASERVGADAQPSCIDCGFADAIGDELDKRSQRRDKSRVEQSAWAAWRPWVAALAAMLLISASVVTLAYMIASRPVIVAQLTQTIACRWHAPQSQLSAGALVKSGQELNLLEGSALITFANGAQLLMKGPTSVRLDSVSQVQLRSGQVAAKVPTQARGFTVTSPLAQFVDLGTAFTLELVDDTSFDLHVFEGLVELRLDERFGAAAQRPLRVAEVRAVHFDVDSGDVTTLHFEEGKQMPF